MSPARRQALSILLPVALALASLAISAFTSYAHNDKALSERVTAVETKQVDDRETLKDIKVTVDRIYDKVAGW